MSGLPLFRIEGEDKHSPRSEKNMYLTKPHARGPGGRGSSRRGPASLDSTPSFHLISAYPRARPEAGHIPFFSPFFHPTFSHPRPRPHPPLPGDIPLVRLASVLCYPRRRRRCCSLMLCTRLSSTFNQYVQTQSRSLNLNCPPCRPCRRVQLPFLNGVNYRRYSIASNRNGSSGRLRMRSGGIIIWAWWSACLRLWRARRGLVPARHCLQRREKKRSEG